MDSLNFFKGYGKVDNNHLEDQSPPQPKTTTIHKPLLVTISILAILFLTFTLAFMLGSLIHESESEPPETESSLSSRTRSNSADPIKAVCNVTRYPDSCFSSISSLNGFPQKPTDPEFILKLSLHVSVNELSQLSTLLKNLASKSNGPALPDCKDQIGDALSRLNDSLSAMDVAPGDKVLTDAKINDVQTWISAAMTDQETCLDGLEEMESTAIGEVKSKMQKSREYTSNSLAIVANIGSLLQQFHMSLH